MGICVMTMKTICLLIVFTIYAKCDCIDPVTLTVPLQEGLARGRSGRTIGGNNSYYAFQGIPYAEPPIGSLRFEAPLPKKSWSGTFDATKDGTECTQGTGPVTGSEDCLFINVYVPKVTGTSLLAALVFIHGGGTFGNSSFYQYGPDYLLDEKIIVVTFNYRLGIFGFLSTGDSVVPGNNGLKDQVLALKWLKNNIKNFGGDPAKVTISGESFGAACAAYHMVSPLSRDLFHGAMFQSGSSLSSWSLYRYSKETNALLGGEYGLDSSNSRSFVAGLKQLNASDLHTKSLLIINFEQTIRWDERLGLIFGPVIEPPSKNAFVTVRSHEALAAGNFAHVPLLLGFNSLEALDFQVQDNLGIFKYDVNNSLLVPIDLNIKPNQARYAASTIKNYYFSKGLIAFGRCNLSKFLSDDSYVRPTVEFVRRTYKQIPVYFYQFSYKGDLGGAFSRICPGVAHAEDLSYIWNWLYVPNLSPQDQIIRKQMVSWWANFTKFGNPTPSTQNSTPEIVWPKSDARITYLDINVKSQVKQNIEKASMELWDSIYDKYGNPPYNTY